MSLFITELKKIHRRHIGMLFAANLVIDFIWMHWAMDDSEFLYNQEYDYLLICLPLINAVFLPVILAAAASRLCDIELKGNTLKMLCTMEPRQSIFHTKLLIGSVYLLLFSLAQTAMIPMLGSMLSARQEIPIARIWLFCISTFGISLILFIIQQSVSLLSTNQLFPLFLGVSGSFVGVFTWFFPQLPLRYMLPWGYYCVVLTVNMYYDEATREVDYYAKPFPTAFFMGFMAFGILVYLIGKKLFMDREI